MADDEILIKLSAFVIILTIGLGCSILYVNATNEGIVSGKSIDGLIFKYHVCINGEWFDVRENDFNQINVYDIVSFKNPLPIYIRIITIEPPNI